VRRKEELRTTAIDWSVEEAESLSSTSQMRW
jgi:hypothetical protein